MKRFPRILPIYFLGFLLLLVAFVVQRRLSEIRRLSEEAGQSDAQTPAAAVPTATHTPDGIRIRGAVPGEWTHDWDAARELARTEHLPFLALFTASDWNRWHKFFAKRVLDTPEWKEWAERRRVVLAWVNQPNDASLVPPGALDRNRRLARELNASAFPAPVLVAPATAKPLDRYHVSDRTSAEDFCAWLQRTWLDTRPGGPKALLSEDDRAVLEALNEEREPLRRAYESLLETERAAHAALVAQSPTTDRLTAWARESDVRLETAREPLDAVQRRIDVLYAKAMDAALPEVSEAPEAPEIAEPADGPDINR